MLYYFDTNVTIDHENNQIVIHSLLKKNLAFSRLPNGSSSILYDLSQNFF